MSEAQAKAIRRDVRRAFGTGVLETLDRREETLDNILSMIGAIKAVLYDLDQRLTDIEMRSWRSRWRRFVNRVRRSVC